ncbi:hypothetical protein JYB62_01315 [Algoriphagus lutimaris]|uniref:hypothetical protein n=1 Tax=Algoriphagus lutimaris TaxID=613197 RepID=UPI00196AF587|nr:hypothetical protein [Algoriphagus lutimaris]MBN3518624.1 hypothetical protein [Algoriphagus lutimaris]
MKKFLFILLAFSFLFSCKEDEKPRPGNGILTVTGIDLGNFPLSNDNGTNWTHVLTNSMIVNFTNETNQTFQLELNPNTIEKSFSIELPLGNYTFHSISVSPDFSDFLPLKAEGQLNLNQEKQSWRFPVDTDYGLLTLSQSPDSPAPKFISHPSIQLNKNKEVYYKYIKSGIKTTLELTSNNPSSSFKVISQSTSFHHLAKIIQKQNENALSTFQKIDFELIQEKVNLDLDHKPINLLPWIQAELGTSLNESSGLALINGRLFSINDKDNDPKIQEFNPEDGQLIREITIDNAFNEDWEDLAQSESHVYIGDFGNNIGSRKNLSILRVSKDELLHSNSLVAEIIEFSFADQVNFSGPMESNNFDCESFFFLNNQLHLFTKNRGDGKTRHYVIKDEITKQEVSPTEEFDTQGLITGADLSPDGKVIALLGYENKGIASQSFIWLFSDFSNTEFFSGRKRRVYLGSPSILSQTEGVVFRTNNEIIISGEEINFGEVYIPGKLSEMNIIGLY